MDFNAQADKQTVLENAKSGDWLMVTLGGYARTAYVISNDLQDGLGIKLQVQYPVGQIVDRYKAEEIEAAQMYMHGRPDYYSRKGA